MVLACPWDICWFSHNIIDSEKRQNMRTVSWATVTSSSVTGWCCGGSGWSIVPRPLPQVTTVPLALPLALAFPLLREGWICCGGCGGCSGCGGGSFILRLRPADDCESHWRRAERRTVGRRIGGISMSFDFRLRYLLPGFRKVCMFVSVFHDYSLLII
jgi:hypothetical protein